MSNTETTEPQAEEPQPQQEIVARAARYYRMTRYVMVAMLLGMGGWFLYDGYVTYPRDNEEARAKGNERVHSDTDIMLQRVLGFALPPLGVATLVWALYNSRGAYRLSGQTVSVPGHEPIAFDQIRRLDKKLWDRKGIAYVDYEPAGGGGGVRRFKLDDFVYERKPTDDIYERIEQYILAADASAQPVADSGDPTNAGQE